MATTVTTTSVSPADRQHPPAGLHHVEHEHGTMNIRDHERVFDGFVKFLVWNAAQSPSLDLSDRPPPPRRRQRPLADILADLDTLTQAQLLARLKRGYAQLLRLGQIDDPSIAGDEPDV